MLSIHINNDMNNDIHIDINMNIDIHIIIDMNIMNEDSNLPIGIKQGNYIALSIVPSWGVQYCVIQVGAERGEGGGGGPQNGFPFT